MPAFSLVGFKQYLAALAAKYFKKCGFKRLQALFTLVLSVAVSTLIHGCIPSCVQVLSAELSCMLCYTSLMCIGNAFALVGQARFAG